jgi:opacity protein-like surface antigen
MKTAAALLVAACALPASAGDWCAEDRSWNRDRERHCEVRELKLEPTRGPLAVDARPNGGIQVETWSGPGIALEAKVVAEAPDAAEAKALAAEVQIVTQGAIRAEGPTTGRRQSWHVSYRVKVPARTDLDLRSTNGGLHVTGVEGRMTLQTMNGGLHLDDVAGAVEGRTTNGGIHVRATGSAWKGEGLDLETTNGGVHLALPAGYNARLETGTVNGGLDVDLPLKVDGIRKGEIRADLGQGGAPIRVRTTNGGVHVRTR